MKWNRVGQAKVHRLFHPQVSAVVTMEFEGYIGGMSAIWCTPLSFSPAPVGVAVAPDHETHRMIIGSRAFYINFVDFSYAETIGDHGETSARDYANKSSAVGFTTIKGRELRSRLSKRPARHRSAGSERDTGLGHMNS